MTQKHKAGCFTDSRGTTFLCLACDDKHHGNCPGSCFCGAPCICDCHSDEDEDVTEVLAAFDGSPHKGVTGAGGSLDKTWFAHPNDLIGGWSVMNCDRRLGEINWDDNPNQDHEVASFTEEQDARHIARLHNEWLANKESGRDGNVPDC